MSDRQRPELRHEREESRRAPRFRPRFTISALYLVAFFLLASIAQVLPGVIDLASEPLTPEEWTARGEALFHHGISVHVSLGIALLVTAVGSYLQVLPGMREG